jgi:signal transduction histidine kinase
MAEDRLWPDWLNPLRRASLARRLFLSAALWSLTILLAAGLILSTIHRRATERAFDDRLNVYLQSIAANLASSSETDVGDQSLGEPKFEMPMSGWYWEIDRIDNPRETVTSGSLFGTRLANLPVKSLRYGQPDEKQGYIIGPDDKRLRAVERMVQTQDEVWHRVKVAGDADEIERSVAAFQVPLTLTLLTLGALLVGTTGFQVSFGLRPLARLSRAVGAIRRGETERIEGDYPPDLAPLALELNLLIEANREILERARTQVGNLAHALKTPLSVIANEAAADDGPLADKVREQTLVMRDQLNWYLDRARAAARAGAIGLASDVAPVLQGLQRVFAKLWLDRGLVFDIAVEEGLRFRGERQDLEEMIGNLVDNAGKYGSREVRATAQAYRDAAGQAMIEIVVEDDGPGLPEAKRAEAMRRGQRLDETRPGAGLGLSIVADLAHLYTGRLTLEDSDLGGLRARLRLPGV